MRLTAFDPAVGSAKKLGRVKRRVSAFADTSYGKSAPYEPDINEAYALKGDHSNEIYGVS